MRNTTENANTPRNSADTKIMWDMLTEEQQAELILINAASKRNQEQERFKNAGAPDLTVEEV